ncbi:MAG: hypothetical protein WBG73_13170 [Coleofasciculaceae cyanobacterium]
MTTIPATLHRLVIQISGDRVLPDSKELGQGWQCRKIWEYER